MRSLIGVVIVAMLVLLAFSFSSYPVYAGQVSSAQVSVEVAWTWPEMTKEDGKDLPRDHTAVYTVVLHTDPLMPDYSIVSQVVTEGNTAVLSVPGPGMYFIAVKGAQYDKNGNLVYETPFVSTSDSMAYDPPIIFISNP